MKAYIKAISYYLPEIIQTNEDLVKEFPEWSAEKVAKKLGISQRHLAAESETSGDLAFKAAQKLISENNIAPNSIDFILLCTQSPDYFLPTTACILQNKLGEYEGYQYLAVLRKTITDNNFDFIRSIAEHQKKQ